MQNIINDVKKTFLKLLILLIIQKLAMANLGLLLIILIRSVPVRKALISKVADINLFWII